PFFRERGTRGKGVIRDQVIRKPVTFHNDLLTLIFEQATNPHEHEHPEQTKVEQDVANFAGIAAFGTHRAVTQFGAVARFFEDLLRIGQSLVWGGTVGFEHEVAIFGEPLQVAWGPGRWWA